MRKEFGLDEELDWEPVEVNEGGGDVLPGLGACEDLGGVVLHIRESVQGRPRQNISTIV